MNSPPLAAPIKPPLPFPAPKWEIFSWCMFDFANSSFTTVVVTVVFPVYFARVVCAGRTETDFLWSLGPFISQTLVLATAPLLGAIADLRAWKKRMLTFTWILCCVFTAALGWVGPGDIALALLLFIVANIGFSTGENLTASFLPELVRPEEMGKVSGFGWAWGYCGGLASLLLCRSLLTGGFDSSSWDGPRSTSLVVAGFFFLAGLPTIFLLRERAQPKHGEQGAAFLLGGFRRLGQTFRSLSRFRQLARFLGVFLVYNCGIAVVIAFSSIYAEQVIHLTPGQLLLFFVLLQITSAIGAFIFGFVQDRWGARRTIQMTLVMWTVVTAGCAFADSVTMFFVLGNLAGLAIGASQSAARALVGIFTPPSRSGEFFGFWGLVWKLSGALGPLAFGAISAATGSRRTAILATSAFFIAGIIGMLGVNERDGREAAELAEREERGEAPAG